MLLVMSKLETDVVGCLMLNYEVFHVYLKCWS